MKGRAAWLLPPLAAILVNLLSLASFFNSDDFGLIRAVRDHGPFGIWSGHGEPFFRPIVSASVWLDWRLWGLEPSGFHLTNVLLHALNTLLVALLAHRLLLCVANGTRLTESAESEAWHRAGTRVAICAGVLFAVLSCHAEAVAWVSGRTDVLSTSFALAAAAIFFSPWRFRLVASAACFALALCCKESPLLLPIFIGGLCFALGRKQLAVQALAGLLLVACYIPIRSAMIGQAFGGYGAGSYFGVGVSGFVKNAVVYAGKALAPGSPQMTDLATSLGLGQKGLFVFAAIFVVILGGSVWVGVRKPATRVPWVVAWSMAGFFLLALPALPLGMNAYTAEGSRFLYLPSVALCLGLGITLGANRAWVGGVVTAFLGLMYTAALWQQNQAWHDAGEDAHRALEAVRDLPADAPLLTVPDSFRGAYVLRNCLDDGIALFGKARPSIPILSAYSYDQLGFEPALEANDGTVSIRVQGTYGCLLSLEPGASAQAGQSPVIRFSARLLVARAPKGFVLTPRGLVVPPR